MLSMAKKGEIDWIRQLPDDMIVRILSFLTLKEAAATSVVSPRWKNLWKHTSKLNFLDHHLYSQLVFQFSANYCLVDLYERQIEVMGKYINWVNSVLQSCELATSALKEFTIHFLVNRSAHHQVTKWLEFAFSRRVERMELIFKDSFINPVVLEEILSDIVDVQSVESLRLRVLHLRWFKMTSSEDALGFFLRYCPKLERLVLEGLTMASDLHIVSPSLEHLDLRSRETPNSVLVSAPNLTCLTVDHGSKRMFLENVPKLVNMHFFCRFGDSMLDFAGAAAQQLETLIITLYHPIGSFSVPEMPKLNKLVVYYRCVELEEEDALLPVTCFIEASPCLEEFKLEIGELAIDRNVFEIPKDGPIFQHRCLKRFVLSGFCGGAGDRIDLVRYIVDSCIALEEIVIGQCDREGLVRHIVDYCVPLDDIIISPESPHQDYVATPQERRDIEQTVRRFVPAHVKLRVV